MGKVTTEDLLNMKSDAEGFRTLNKFLKKIKPLMKQKEASLSDPYDRIPLEAIEKAIHGLCRHYGYMMQGIQTYCDNGQFNMYTTALMNSKREWLGNVYGKTLWEIETKTLIKIYSLILKEKREKEENEKS